MFEIFSGLCCGKDLSFLKGKYYLQASFFVIFYLFYRYNHSYLRFGKLDVGKYPIVAEK